MLTPREEQEMAEVLESECAVEMDKLATLCRLGIPERLRAEAWKYLLGVTRPEKAQELSLGKLMEQRYLRLERAWQSDPQLELTRRIKAEVRGHNAAAPHLRSRQRLERLLRTYLHCHAADYTSGMLHLLAPFEHVYRDSDTDAYFGFEGLMGQLSWALTFEGRKQMAVALLTLLRHLLPELYAHLEAEERLTTGSPAGGGGWLDSWLSLLLSKELPLPCVLRLWDAYFSAPPEGSLQELHTFVCLAVLETCQDELLELDGDEELPQYLQHLPAMDMGRVVTSALNMRDDCLARGLCGSGGTRGAL